MAETAAPPRPAEQADRGPAYDGDFFLWTRRDSVDSRQRWRNSAAKNTPLGKAPSETGFALGTSSNALPYTPEQILDDEFYPGSIEER